MYCTVQKFSQDLYFVEDKSDGFLPIIELNTFLSLSHCFFWGIKISYWVNSKHTVELK